MQGWSQAQLVPSNRGRMCTLTNKGIIALRCITTKAMNTNNVFVTAFRVHNHGFLRHRCNIRRQTHIRMNGFYVIKRPLHVLSLRARGTQVQISEQPLQICNGALPIHTQTITHSTSTFTQGVTMPHCCLRCSSALVKCCKRQ